MLPLIVLNCLSTRLYYLQNNICLTFPLRASLARNENTRAINGDKKAHLCRYMQTVLGYILTIFIQIFAQNILIYHMLTVRFTSGSGEGGRTRRPPNGRGAISFVCPKR